jgi:coenzyme PQQ precursor peptide PqqA
VGRRWRRVPESIAVLKSQHNLSGEEDMEWMKPEFEEISVNCEINSYANGKL